MKRRILCGECGTIFVYDIIYKEKKDGTIIRSAYVECPNCKGFSKNFEILEKRTRKNKDTLS